MQSDFSRLYDHDASLQRLAVLRNLLDDAQVDCLLLVGGVDGQFNALASQTISWLLFGSCHGSVAQISATELVEFAHCSPGGFESPRSVDILPSSDLVEDIMVAVHRDSVRIYCPFPLVAAKTAAWPSCVVISPPGQVFHDEDIDELESFKLHSFVRLCGDASIVGVPVPSSVDGQKVAMEIEKWPIVQAYALEDHGSSRGFFTQTRTIRSVSERLSLRIFSNADVQSSSVMREIVCPILARHVNDSVRFVARHGTTSPDDLPIAIYFSHGEHSSHHWLRDFRPSVTCVSDGVYKLTVVDPKWPVVCHRMLFVRSGTELSSVEQDCFRRYRALIDVVRGGLPTPAEVKVDRVLLEPGVELVIACHADVMFSDIVGVTENIPVLLGGFDSRMDVSTLYDVRSDSQPVSECAGLSVRILVHDQIVGPVELDAFVVSLSSDRLILSNSSMGPMSFDFSQDVLGVCRTADNDWTLLRLSPTMNPLFGVYHSTWLAIKNDHQFVRRHIHATDSSLAELPSELRTASPRGLVDPPDTPDLDKDPSVLIFGHFNSGKEDLARELVARGLAAGSVYVAGDDEVPFLVVRRFALSKKRISLVISCCSRSFHLGEALSELGFLEQYSPGFVQAVHLSPGTVLPEFLKIISPSLRVMTIEEILEAARFRLFLNSRFKSIRSKFALIKFSRSVAQQFLHFCSFPVSDSTLVSQILSDMNLHPSVHDSYVSDFSSPPILKVSTISGQDATTVESLVSSRLHPVKENREPRVLSSVQDLSRSEVEQVRQVHLFDPLPDGYFFNGVEYVSFDGYRSRFHPDMEKFLTEFLGDLQERSRR